jgi:nicotinamide-nucleotide amidase
MPTAEILSQGDEVVTGQVADTNAAWLATQLTSLGFTVVRHVSVGDRMQDICDLFRETTIRADLSLCTGGLGPTDDDLTAAAAAKAFDMPLALDTHALETIRAMYARYERTMPKVNEKQAWLPAGATRLDNDWGTAPGFAIDTDTGWLACMPGVPREMRAMFEHRVAPHLLKRFQLTPGRLVTLRTTGIGESNLQERIGSFDHPRVTLSFRTKLPENHIKLRFTADVPESEIRELVNELTDRIGSPIFAIEGLGGSEGSLAEVVGRSLTDRGQTLSIAESCTGGGISALCTAVSGATRWFTEGVVTYANEAKVRRLGVRTETLELHGAVSQATALEMAAGIRDRAGTDYGLACTGIAGPSGGSPDKPVGTVHIALACPDGSTHRTLRLGGSRSRIQSLAAAAALDLLRRVLQEHISPS